MMATMVTKDFTPKWDDDRDPYVDMFLWKANFKKGTIDIPYDQLITVGIKHGIGARAGGGHFWPDDKFRYDDVDLEFLSEIS